MKTSSATIALNNTVIMVDDRLSTKNFTDIIMKKLSNTSPFLLLLLPFFMMLALTLSVSSSSNTDEFVVKPAKTTTSIAKQVSAIFQ